MIAYTSNIMHQNKQTPGFTLVELIVVITILAILWTLASIFLSGYAEDSRNSKRIYEVKDIARMVNIKLVDSINILTLVKDTDATITWSNISVSGYSDYDSFSGSYRAWGIDYAVLWVQDESYYDSTFEESYRIGATNIWINRYEIAATIESGDDLNTYVSGTWYARSSSDVRWPRELIKWNVFYIAGWYDGIWFQIWDKVGIASGDYIITDLKNGNEIHLNEDITTPWANIFLDQNETRHLIKKWDSNFPIDVDRGQSFVPYIRP